MTTLSDWEQQLAALRDDAAATGVVVRMQWWPVVDHRTDLPLAMWLVRRRSRGPDLERYQVGVYPADVERGALPDVILPVLASSPIGSLDQGARVLAFGAIEVGGALRLQTEAGWLEPAGPCWLPVLRRRKYRFTS